MENTYLLTLSNDSNRIVVGQVVILDLKLDTIVKALDFLNKSDEYMLLNTKIDLSEISTWENYTLDENDELTDTYHDSVRWERMQLKIQAITILK